MKLLPVGGVSSAGGVLVAFTKRLAERAGTGESPESGTSSTGQQLLAEFAQYGRQGPFEEIVRRYAGMVYSTCSRVTKNRQDAEDATQAVFLTLALQVKKGTEIKALGPWLQQVAKRLSLDTRRGGKRRKTREETHQREQIWRAECSEPSLPTADLDEVKAVLHEELNKLPSKYRLPLVLHYFGGMSREEMAAELNCNPSTLGVRIFRARAILAERLNDRGIDFTPAMLPVLLQQLVKHTISHAVVGATTRAAAAAAMGHNVGGMVSHRVILLTRRAATAAVIGKLKLAALGVLISCTLLAAGARALCTVPSLGIRDFLDRQVQSLVRPLLQPFSIPLRVTMARRPGDGFRPMVTNPNLSAVAVATPGAAPATGWRFGPLVPPALVGDDADLVAAIDPSSPVPDLFATIGGSDNDAPDPAVAMANQDQSFSTTLIDGRDGAGGISGAGGSLDLPRATDDAADVSTAASASTGSSGADFNFHLPTSESGVVGGSLTFEFAVSGVNGDHFLASTATRVAAGRAGARQSSGSSTSNSGGTATESAPSDPPTTPPPAGATDPTNGNDSQTTGKTRRPSSQNRPNVRRGGSNPWNVTGSGAPPTGIVALRTELLSDCNLRPPMPMLGGANGLPARPLLLEMWSADADRMAATPAAEFDRLVGEHPDWLSTDRPVSNGLVPTDEDLMSARPAAEFADFAAVPAVAVVTPSPMITPEPTAALLIAAAAGVASMRRRRRDAGNH